MTREEQRKIKEDKKQAKIAFRLERKEQQREARSWQKMMIRFKAMGAWIEDETNLITTN